MDFLNSEENLTGIKPEAAFEMKQPVLVRIVRDVAAEDIPGMIGALNADFTNRRDPANLAANRGSRVGERTRAAFAGINDQTVSAYLDSPNVAVKVLQAMVADGALQNTDLPGLYDFANDKWLGDGRNSGKAQIEQALFGAILPDSRLLDDLSDGMKRKLVRALPGLIRLRRNNSPELASLFEAIALHNEFQAFKDSPEAKGLKPAGKLELFRKPDMANVFTGEVPPEKSGPAWDMFLELNSMRTQREVADYFTRKADELTGTGRGLFSLAQSPIETLYQDGQRPGDAALARDTAAWRERVDAFLAGTLDRTQTVTMLEQTPLVLQLLGAKNRQVVTSHNILKKILVDKHHLPEETLKQVPEALADPVMVFESATHGGDLVAMLDLKDQNGATIIVPIGLEQRGGRGDYAVNFVFSAYGQKNDAGIVNNRWFVNQAQKGLLLYRNMQKSRDWARTSGLQLPGVSVPNRGNRRILTDADLVKARNANFTLYQSGFHGSPHRFDKFTLKAMSSGEGGQVHGWGIYALRGDTESRKKHADERYRKRLLDKAGITINGVTYAYDRYEHSYTLVDDNDTNPDFVADYLLDDLRGSSVEKVMALYERRANEHREYAEKLWLPQTNLWHNSGLGRFPSW